MIETDPASITLSFFFTKYHMENAQCTLIFGLIYSVLYPYQHVWIFPPHSVMSLLMFRTIVQHYNMFFILELNYYLNI
jgi:hypothetical protein